MKKNMVAAAGSSSVGQEFWAVVLLACAVIHANAGRPITKSYEPASAPEEAPNEKIITFFMQLHSSSSTTATVGGANTLNGLGTNGAINVNGGITPQPLTFPAASLPNTNNNGLNIGGAGFINNGGVGTVGTSIIGGGGLINSNGIGGLINNNGIGGNGGLINGNGLLGGTGGQQLGGGILSNPETNVPFGGAAAGMQQGAFPEMMTLEQPVYEEPEEKATTVMGMAQGYYLSSLLQHEEGPGHVMSIAFTATLTHLAEEDIPSSIQLAGELNSIDEEGSEGGEMIVVGGTGVFHSATGHAMVQPLPDHPGLLKFTVSLSY